MSLTTDRNDPQLNKIKENGQQETYLVLSDEERAKGFIRPVRQKYKHVGPSLRGLVLEGAEVDTPEIKEYNKKYNTAYYAHVLYSKDYAPLHGRYLTKLAYEALVKGEEHGGGCGCVTMMDIKLAETYARDPKFYGGTFCCGCHTHYPVSEFLWEGTKEEVGS